MNPPQAGGPAENAAESLASFLDHAVCQAGPRVSDWRFELRDGWSAGAGLHESNLGGPYEPPSMARGLSGSVYLRWSDGLCSYGNLGSATLNDWPAQIDEWRSIAYQDQYAPPVLGPTPLPEVATFDPEAAALLDSDPAPLLDVLAQSRERLRSAGLASLEGSVGAASRARSVYSSAGLRASQSETIYSLSISAEMLYSRGYSKRRLIESQELSELIGDVADTTRQLLVEDGWRPAGEAPVVLPPAAAASFLHTFVGANLSGSAVVNGKSAFTLDDFRANRRVFREDFSLLVDTLLPLERAASAISSEGVAGGRVLLVRDGRLITPRLNLKNAARCGLAPTPSPAGPPGLLIDGKRSEKPLDEVLWGISAGLLVHFLMGMHSQDSASGRYSVSAPQAQVIRRGERAGRTRVLLSGNFFDHLNDERTTLVRFPWGVNPGLLIWPRATSESAR